jgi:hypothetical protein
MKYCSCSSSSISSVSPKVLSYTALYTAWVGWGERAPKACPLGHVPRACLGAKKGGHNGASMTGENRQLVTSEPVEFEK